MLALCKLLTNTLNTEVTIPSLNVMSGTKDMIIYRGESLSKLHNTIHGFIFSLDTQTIDAALSNRFCQPGQLNRQG